MTDSQTLLAEYARTGSEAAFRELSSEMKITRPLPLPFPLAIILVAG